MKSEKCSRAIGDVDERRRSVSRGRWIEAHNLLGMLQRVGNPCTEAGTSGDRVKVRKVWQISVKLHRNQVSGSCHLGGSKHRTHCLWSEIMRRSLSLWRFCWLGWLRDLRTIFASSGTSNGSLVNFASHADKSR